MTDEKTILRSHTKLQYIFQTFRRGLLRVIRYPIWILCLLAFLFIISGAERVTYARRLRYFGLPDSGLTTATGVLNIVCGVAFLLMPALSGVVFGYVVAAYLIVGGASLVVEGISMRPIER